MTVTYTGEVATSTGLGCFIKLLRRWRGSIYKIVWPNLLLFLIIYYGLNITYFYILDTERRRYFERMVSYCAKYGGLIPLSFVLGFYVNIVYTRWWSQFNAIPFPDNLAVFIGATIKGQSERARIIRRTIVRYVCLTFTMTLTMISPKVKKRFPTLNHLMEAGLLTEHEKNLMDDLFHEHPSYTKHWLPIAWAASVSTRARHEGIITSDLGVKGVLDELNAFRTKCGNLLGFDWISVPLVYTQVVTLAVYFYLIVTVIGYQFTEANQSLAEIIVFSFPFMPIIEFFFYVGWLKVAETLINPFGDDDDDFDVVWMIDRHIQVCFLLVDKIHQEHPTLSKDAYWSEIVPSILPFTIASQEYINEYPECSTDNVHVKSIDQDFVIPEYVSQPDGKGSRDGLWRKVNGSFVRQKGSMKGVRVHSSKVDHKNDDEVNTYEESGPNKIEPLSNTPGPAHHSEEFERLREERLCKQREKLLKCVELLKLDKEGRKEIINDIIK